MKYRVVWFDGNVTQDRQVAEKYDALTLLSHIHAMGFMGTLYVNTDPTHGWVEVALDSVDENITESKTKVILG